MLRSVKRLERRGGFRERLLETPRDYLEYVAIANIQRAERDTWPRESGPEDSARSNGRQGWERFLRRADRR